MGDLVAITTNNKESIMELAAALVEEAESTQGALLIYKTHDGEIVLLQSCINDHEAIAWMELTKTQLCSAMVMGVEGG